MPTGSEFDDIAARLDALAGRLGGPLSSVGYANQGVAVGGHLEPLIQRTIDDACGHVDAAVDVCFATADEARTRAEACHRYSDAMARFREALDRVERQLAADPTMLGLVEWPVHPARPGPWAEEG